MVEKENALKDAPQRVLGCKDLTQYSEPDMVIAVQKVVSSKSLAISSCRPDVEVVGSSQVEAEGTLVEIDEPREVDGRLLSSQERWDIAKNGHDLAKAVKSDDAEVPVHMWDIKVCRGPPTERQIEKLAIMREFFMRVYRRRMW